MKCKLAHIYRNDAMIWRSTADVLWLCKMTYSNIQLWCWIYINKHKDDVGGLVQDCRNSIANALELLQLCTKP